MSTLAPNPEQRTAIEAEGRVFLSAGAGTGKTAVLVERFVRAVCDRGIDVGSILVITYTRKAAGELRARIRRELRERGRHDLARELDGAWIATIHGFCARLLRTYPFEAGLDPRFRELDGAQASVLAGEAFAEALDEFCAREEPERLQLLATYGTAALRRMLIGVYETLRSAGRELVLELGERAPLSERVEALRDASRCLAIDAGATELQRANAAGMLDVLAGSPAPDRLVDLSAHKVRGSERTASYEEARKVVEQSALDELAVRDRDLLQALLEGFARAYDAAKRREGVLDFEDLQLNARDLLRSNERIREREHLRFAAIMVDEFQDTNRLQCELIDLVADGPAKPELFFVGDEFQSIYGFRHADVQVFRERRESEGGGLALVRNYRSRPEVLAAVNHLFQDEFGDGFQPLAASGEFPDPVFGHPVELLVTEKETYADTGVHWRRAEAKHIARRVRELVDEGAATPGEIVLLFAAGTDADAYEEELRQAGLPTYRATGRGYFGQQQVVDLLSYLLLLQNRYDDQALVAVLASPFVGVSNDALVLIRRAASKRPLFTGIEKGLPPELDERDAQLIRAFLQRYERLVRALPRLPLERLCEQIVSEHDYDLAVLTQWDGRRRYANLRKLARLARSYEELRGPNLEGFVRFVRDQEAVGAKELEAVAEEEGSDSVRLLTIHAAKGLEFKVVVVADAGRDKRAPDGDEILALADGRFGFKVADPATSKRRGAFDYDEVRQAREEEDRAERLRLYYVAMTRAVDRLIVSGAIDRESTADRSTPMGWVLQRLDAAEELAAANGAPLELVRGDALVQVRFDRYREEPEALEVAGEPGQLELFSEGAVEPLPPPAPTLPELHAIPEPALHHVRRLSFTALSLFETCSYRYFAERVAGMRSLDVQALGHEGLSGTAIGSAVHAELEHVDLASPALAAGWEERVRAAYPRATDEEVERIRGLTEAYCTSELAARVSALDGVAKERHFTFEHDGVLLHGFLDTYHRAGDRALVVDYKSNVLEGLEPGEIVARSYGLQRLVYALACFRAGAGEVEVAYLFLERPDELVVTTFTRAQVPELEAQLSAAIARLRTGEFRPTPSEYACAGCPALDVVCAGPRLAYQPVASDAAAALA
ncbi:MAG: UvrD-helicase domain-containing protein [Actinobacteria bacterium]|nr:UvrD-helicase domain-containing protein [Actinomycetota bacterium]